MSSTPIGEVSPAATATTLPARPGACQVTAKKPPMSRNQCRLVGLASASSARVGASSSDAATTARASRPGRVASVAKKTNTARAATIAALPIASSSAAQVTGNRVATSACRRGTRCR